MILLSTEQKRGHKPPKRRFKMSTTRFTLDGNGRRAYIGSPVYYKNKVWLLEDIQYLRWNSEQYLTLQDPKNKNKKVEFVQASLISAVN